MCENPLEDRSHAPAWERSFGRSSVLYALATRRWSGLGGVTTLERGNDKLDFLALARIIVVDVKS